MDKADFRELEGVAENGKSERWRREWMIVFQSNLYP